MGKTRVPRFIAKAEKTNGKSFLAVNAARGNVARNS
jgi:hypothetical protein